jgi:hypothetical protein
LGLLTVTLALVLSATGYGASPSCDRYAAPGGSDAAPGTLAAPLGSAQRLADSLSPGQVGCLRGGTYQGASPSGDSYRELKITRPGITLTSAPGEEARIAARLWVARGADGVTISNLTLDGANSRDLPSPTVNADRAVFSHDDVTNDHTSICFAVGSPDWGRAHDTVIEESRVHGCGQLPSTNQEHGIYIAAADRTVIRSNWIYDNADRGIQLYPDAQGTVITGNVLYRNGEGIIFSGDETAASSGSRVTGNVIAASQIRRNVESYYPGGAPVGRDNLVSSNCIHGAPGSYYGGADGSGVDSPQVGFNATRNVNQAPSFVDASAGDFRLAPGSACAGVLDPAADAGLPGPLSAGPAPASSAAPVTSSPPAATSAPPPASATPPPATTTPPPATTPAPPRAAPKRVVLRPARHSGRRRAKRHHRRRHFSHRGPAARSRS